MDKITLKAARVNKGFTQAEAAARLNVTKKTLGSWENGKTIPKVDKIEAICSLYNVSFDSLFFVKNNALSV